MSVSRFSLGNYDAEEITVQTDEFGSVLLTFDGRENAEWRELRPDEACLLAALLRHYAGEADD